jgi:hypothetical protein
MERHFLIIMKRGIVFRNKWIGVVLNERPRNETKKGRVQGDVDLLFLRSEGFVLLFSAKQRS